MHQVRSIYYFTWFTDLNDLYFSTVHSICLWGMQNCTFALDASQITDNKGINTNNLP